MAGDRTLKLSILADVDQLNKNLKKGGEDVDSFGKQIVEISKKATIAFAAIGSAVFTASAAFAKAAAEDELAANKLAATISAVTGATQEQTKAVEQYITKTAVATGITDDQLRPAFERLVRSTKNVDDATKLLNLSLDLSAATGKPLEAIANALGRAYDGNTTALGRLGLGIDANLIKSKDFNAIYETLNKTFGEFSENRSEEAIVKFQRLQVALDEAKEAVGAALLPAFEALGDWLLNEGVPRLNAFIAGLIGDRSLSSSFTEAQRGAENFGIKMRGLIDKVIEYKDVIIIAAAATATVWAVSKISAAVTATITLINLLIKAYNALKASAIVAAVASRMAINPLLGAAAGTAVFAAIGAAAKFASGSDVDEARTGLSYNEQREAQIAGSRASSGTPSASGFGTGGGISGSGGGGGSTTGSALATISAAPSLLEQVSAANAEKYFMEGRSYGIAEVRRREMQADTGVFQPIPSGFDVAAARRGQERSINITINGAVDPVGTARQVATLLNTEASTSGSFQKLGISRFGEK